MTNNKADDARGPARDQRQGRAPQDERSRTERSAPGPDDDDELDSKGDRARGTKPSQADRPRTPGADAPRVERDQERRQGR
jgi:hypothetical protein